jgi:hypothetical protein
MAGFASVAAAVAVNIPEAVTVLEATSRNLRRLIDMELLRARWVSDIRKHPGYAKREVKAVPPLRRFSPKSSDRRAVIWQSC